MARERLKALENEINKIDNGRININHEKAKIMFGRG
jgi:hypothetical protein